MPTLTHTRISKRQGISALAGNPVSSVLKSHPINNPSNLKILTSGNAQTINPSLITISDLIL